jgi:hypothetical protein
MRWNEREGGGTKEEREREEEKKGKEEERARSTVEVGDGKFAPEGSAA